MSAKNKLGLLGSFRTSATVEHVHKATKIQTWKSDIHCTTTCNLKSVSNCSVQAGIWTVVRVVCDILDALLDPDSLLVQLVFPESEVIQLSLEIDQLICYFSGVTAWTYTPETKNKCVLLYIKCLAKKFSVIPIYATQILDANELFSR